ncbi:2-dehydro-3-deoxygalactonokinase [Vibrio sp. NTOU-M3]|uniref:2-dehydro-3-deoxygalactonokinase n=1 Tax=Vibrio sp. NTOU-M3 TaxID=3234954 RepID=UPI00349FC1BD
MNWIAVDWGTTNFRAFLMTSEGDCLDRISAEKGLLSITPEEYPDVFEQLTSHWTEEYGPLPVLMAGMVGSQQGWREVPYVSVPVDAKSLAKDIELVDLKNGGTAGIVCGVTCVNKFGIADVMRGEEVQLVGLQDKLKSDFFAVLYGTHSKHAHCVNGRLSRFSTVMTGELYSLLVEHSILGRALPKQLFDKEAFVTGVTTGYQHPLNHILFSARTSRLFRSIDETHVESYLSGLLIGHEFSQTESGEKAYLIGSKRLATHYSLALTHLDLEHEIIDGDECFLAGMTHIFLHGDVNE